MIVAAAVTYEDAWGDDDVDAVEEPVCSSGRCITGAGRGLQAQQRLCSSKQASASGRTDPSPTVGAHTLQAYCLGCLGPYAEALIEHGDEVLPYLPPEAKLALLAIARRQGILADQALRLLADSTWTSLDISFSTVSNSCMQSVMQTLPNLLALDITGCRLHPRTLQLLGQHCPQLQVLRLGHTGLPSDDIFSPTVKSLMPTVTNPASANDSWEALLPDSRKLTGLSSTTSSNSLSQLTHLLWPSIPTKTADMLARKFPKVIVNPQSGSCPAAADPSIALDDAAIQAVAPFWQVDDEPEEPVEPTPLVPLSERFRLAYVSRAERVAAKAERNYQQRRRRELRNNTVLQALAKFNYL